MKRRRIHLSSMGDAPAPGSTISNPIVLPATGSAPLALLTEALSALKAGQSTFTTPFVDTTWKVSGTESDMVASYTYSSSVNNETQTVEAPLYYVDPSGNIWSMTYTDSITNGRGIQSVEMINVQPAPTSVLTGISEGNVEPGVPLPETTSPLPPSPVASDFLDSNGVYLASGAAVLFIVLILFWPKKEQSALTQAQPAQVSQEVNVA